MDAVFVKSRPSPDGRCAFCHDDLDDDSAVCADCNTVLHRDCRALLVECPTLGCRQSVFTLTRPTAGARPARVRPAFRQALARLVERERSSVTGSGHPVATARAGEVVYRVSVPYAVWRTVARFGLLMSLLAACCVLADILANEPLILLPPGIFILALLLVGFRVALRGRVSRVTLCTDEIVFERTLPEESTSVRRDEIVGYYDRSSDDIQIRLMRLTGLSAPLSIPTPTEPDRVMVLYALDRMGLRRLND
ncbi:MAG TPA: hypothetical protein VFF73_03620 [Planctomycetota bacterium]|nr:hypothetical protein [Planctomycetota bacterium]